MEVDIEITGLKKFYTKRKSLFQLFKKKDSEDKITRAIDGVDISIYKGELFGLLGPNGAGKTTLVKCISTLLIPDEGTIKVRGFDVVRQTNQVRRIIGLLTSGERSLYWKMNALDNLYYFAALYGIPKNQLDERINYLLDLVELKKEAKTRVEKFSSGMKQKLSFARTILHNPEVILLDEPTLGLDPTFSRFIRDFIKEHLNKKLNNTILLTTHYMEEADKLCDRVAIIDKGKIISVGHPQKLKSDLPFERVIQLRVSGSIHENDFCKLDNITKVAVSCTNGISDVRIHGTKLEDTLNNVASTIMNKGDKLLSISITEPALEDVFIYFTGRKFQEESV